MQNSKLKNILVVAVLVGVFGSLAAGKYLGWFNTNGVNTTSQASAPTETASVVDKVKTAVGIGSAPAVSVELPPEPVNGVTKGVVEVGASGFNSFVAVVDKQGRYKVTSKQFGDSLAYEGMTTTDEVKSGLKKYIAQMFNKGVEKQNVHFVISSGALKEPKMKTIADGIRAAGFFVNEVTPQQEGIWALTAAMNPNYKDRAFVVDIGSGNTKISWFEGSSPRTIEASGSKYFQSGISDADVFEELKQKASKVPASKRELCFLIGGVPNDLAKQTGSNSDFYITLRNLDSYSAGDNKKVASGLNILKAIQSATGVKQFVFCNDANFTIGFLMSLK